MNELVSIVIPSYCSARFIAKTIESVLAQTYRNWEVVVVDDYSVDNTVEIVNTYVNNEPRIKLIRLKENSGAAISRNTALDVANGRFIAFLDSDDIWRPDKLEKQVSFMLERKIPISFTSYELIDDNGVSKDHVYHSVEKINQQEYLKNTIIGLSTSMIDTKFVGNDFRFIDIRTRQDTSLWISILGRGFVAYGMSEVLASYRVHSNSISSNKYRAAKQVWNLYFNIHRLGFFKSVYCFLFYLYNAIKKRI